MCIINEKGTQALKGHDSEQDTVNKTAGVAAVMPIITLNISGLNSSSQTSKQLFVKLAGESQYGLF